MKVGKAEELKVDYLRYKDLLRFKRSDRGDELWDPIRRKWVLALPEEIVRQLTIQWLMDKGIAKGRMTVEKEIAYQGQKRRVDLLCYDGNMDVEILVECKSHKVSLGETVVNQIVQYNQKVNAMHLLITNGIDTVWVAYDEALPIFVQ